MRQLSVGALMPGRRAGRAAGVLVTAFTASLYARVTSIKSAGAPGVWAGLLSCLSGD